MKLHYLSIQQCLSINLHVYAIRGWGDGIWVKTNTFCNLCFLSVVVKIFSTVFYSLKKLYHIMHSFFLIKSIISQVSQTGRKCLKEVK